MFATRVIFRFSGQEDLHSFSPDPQFAWSWGKGDTTKRDDTDTAAWTEFDIADTGDYYESDEAPFNESSVFLGREQSVGQQQQSVGQQQQSVGQLGNQWETQPEVEPEQQLRGGGGGGGEVGNTTERFPATVPVTSGEEVTQYPASTSRPPMSQPGSEGDKFTSGKFPASKFPASDESTGVTRSVNRHDQAGLGDSLHHNRVANVVSNDTRNISRLGSTQQRERNRDESGEDGAARPQSWVSRGDKEDFSSVSHHSFVTMPWTLLCLSLAREREREIVYDYRPRVETSEEEAPRTSVTSSVETTNIRLDTRDGSSETDL